MNSKISLRRGLSLLELVVVLSIAVAIGVLVRFVFSDKENPQQLTQSEQMVGSFLRIARLKALAEAEAPKGETPFRKARTRLIIHADPSDPEKYLRFFGIVYGDSDERRWYSEIEGNYLPDGVYFAIPENVDFDTQMMRLEYPRGSGSSRLQLNEKGDMWLYYEFSKQGLSDSNQRKYLLQLISGRKNKKGKLEPSNCMNSVTFQFSNDGKAIVSSRRAG